MALHLMTRNSTSLPLGADPSLAIELLNDKGYSQEKAEQTRSLAKVAINMAIRSELDQIAARYDQIAQLTKDAQAKA
jgi:hypothetical protein